MFVYLYKFKVKSGMDAAFRQRWSAFTELIYLERGSLGSRLHKDPAGDFIAYAQWPSREIAEKTFTPSAQYQQAQREMMDCLITSEIVFQLDVLESLWKESAT